MNKKSSASIKNIKFDIKYPSVYIILLNWNGVKDTVECIDSLRKITYPNYKIVVVDNASTGNDTEILEKTYDNFIRLIKNKKNYGFSEGNNIGMKISLNDTPSPDYFLLLNSDTTVAPNFLTELVQISESNSNIGIVGPKIYWYDYNGSKNIIWSAGGIVNKWREPFYHHIGFNCNDSPEYNVVKEVGFVSGAAMMIKRGVAEEISFLNSHYFFGYEEIECCLKAQKAGYKIIYVPLAKVWHKAHKARRHESGYNPTIADPAPYYYLIKNNFPTTIYFYHLLLMPILFVKWGIVYVLFYHDKETLFKFFSDTVKFIHKKIN